MTARVSSPLSAAGISVLLHMAALAAMIWLAAPLPKAAPPALPQIELLPPLPITPMPQDARPSPIDLPVTPQPSLAAPFAPPPPVPESPPAVTGASQQKEHPPPVRPPAKRKPNPLLAPQPLAIKEAATSETPPTAAPQNGNETKNQTVIADTSATSQPAGPPPDYIGLIRARLQQVKEYPLEARRDSEEGTVMMGFALDRSGRVLAWRIQKGSNVPALDEEAAEMIARASPFPPFPKTLDRATLDLLVPIEFTLK